MRYLLIILKILTLSLILGLLQNSYARDRIFLLAGQSNMQGLGATYQLPYWQRRTPHNVEFYYKGSRRPLPLARGGRFGPEVSFAHRLARAFPRDRIILIKVAAGGSPITEWMPGTHYYRTLLRQVQFSLGKQKNPPPIDAILWMQGESDAGIPNRAHRYAGHLKQLITQLRRDLRSPHSQFLIGQVNPLPSRFPQINILRANQLRVHQQTPGTQLVSTQGLSKMPDQLHYDTQGQIGLGERFAAAYFRSQHHRRSPARYARQGR
ncbi:MAG: sialate O-acetylesterase [Thiolinea sp.]